MIYKKELPQEKRHCCRKIIIITSYLLHIHIQDTPPPLIFKTSNLS